MFNSEFPSYGSIPARRRTIDASPEMAGPEPAIPRLGLLLIGLFLIFPLLGPASAWAGNVAINAPGASAQVTGLTPFSATATSNGLPITTMKVYLDSQNPEIATYNGNGTSSLTVNTVYSIANGSHTLTANAWDSGGTLYQSIVSFTVSSTGVVMNAPGANSQIVSPVPFTATATSNGAVVTTMKVYQDFNSSPVSSFNGNGTSTLTGNATYAMSNGSHILIASAWDTGGQLYQSAVNFTVASTGVVISSPAQNAQVSSPVAFNATATSNGPAITAIKSYLDFNTTPIGTYNGNGTSSLNAQDSYTINSGSHTLIVNAWDTGGQLYQSAVNFSVSSGGGGSIPPANATETANINEMTDWGSCSSASCSGAGGGTQTTTFNVSSPSLDGNSVQFNTAGSADADVLHWNNLPANDSVTHFVLDYNFLVDNVTPIQALEFDFIQGTGTQKFNFSSQCDNSNPSSPVWDTWDEPSTSWTKTNISCANVLNTNNWHHVRLYGEMLNSGSPSAQTHYIWIEVDGTQTAIPDAYAFHNAVSSSWHKLVVQVQEDLNSNPGNGFNEYVDELNLFVW